MAARRFFISPETVHDPQPEITGSDAGHISRVLRLVAGDEVELFDGTGNGYRAAITSVLPKRVRFHIVASFPLLSESPVKITLAQGFLKDRKMDELIRPLTELGIHRWIPFYAARSIPAWERKRVAKRMERWKKIALESVKQCRRGYIPTIDSPCRLKDVLSKSEQAELKILFYEDEPRGFDVRELILENPESIMVVVGPEGGFDPDEAERAKAEGFVTAGLGPRILRAQTAAIAVCTLIQYIFGDMGPSHSKRELGNETTNLADP